MPRCVALFSGGLDSVLALALMARQGVEVVAFHACHVFHPRTDCEEGRGDLAALAERAGAREVVFRDVNRGLFELVRSPAHGRGKHLNPCIDCRMLTLEAAAEVMRERGADFLVSGEVLGQRPMSQRRDALAAVDRRLRENGLGGLLLRPLCARLLPPTLPETEGLVDRERLYGFSGRSRKPQMALAAELGITGYSTPAGGCLLTDAGFCARLRDLMEHEPEWGADDVRLLRIGRHFRLAPGLKLIASRNDRENERLKLLAAPGDTCFINAEKPGAIVMLRGRETEPARRTAAGLAVYYSKHRDRGRARVACWHPGRGAGARRDCGEVEAVDPATLRDRYVGRA